MCIVQFNYRHCLCYWELVLAWELCSEYSDRGIELMDPTLDESCPHIEVPICICIGLLCMLKLIILENDGISISKIKVVPSVG